MFASLGCLTVRNDDCRLILVGTTARLSWESWPSDSVPPAIMCVQGAIEHIPWFQLAQILTETSLARARFTLTDAQILSEYACSIDSAHGRQAGQLATDHPHG